MNPIEFLSAEKENFQNLDSPLVAKYNEIYSVLTNLFSETKELLKDDDNSIKFRQKLIIKLLSDNIELEKNNYTDFIGVVGALSKGGEPLTEETLKVYSAIGLYLNNRIELDEEKKLQRLSKFLLSLDKAEKDMDIVETLSNGTNALRIPLGIGASSLLKSQINNFENLDDYAPKHLFPTIETDEFGYGVVRIGTSPR